MQTCREKKKKKSWHFFVLRWRFELTAAMATEKPAWQYPDLWYWSTVSLSKSTSKIREPWHCYSTREKHTHTCTQTRAYTPKYKTIKSIKNSKKMPQQISNTANRYFFQHKNVFKILTFKALEKCSAKRNKTLFQLKADTVIFGNIN